jgi:hypothetical protein
VTHADLVAAAIRWLRRRPHSCSVVFAEFATHATIERPDALGFTYGGTSILVECKVSRGDFLADRTKPHRAFGMGARRWFLTPTRLVSAHEVPVGWGLAELRGQRVHIVVDAPLVDPATRNHQAEAAVLTAAVWRHENGVRWFPETGRFERYALGRTA